MFKGLMKMPQKTAEAFLLVLSVLMLSAKEGAVLPFTHITLQTAFCPSCVSPEAEPVKKKYSLTHFYYGNNIT